MKKIKVNLLAIIGMMVAVATLAFTAPKENVATTHWFETDENGNIIEYLGSDAAGESELTLLECEMTLPVSDLCGAGLPPSQVEPDGQGGFQPNAQFDIDSPDVTKIYKDPLGS